MVFRTAEADQRLMIRFGLNLFAISFLFISRQEPLFGFITGAHLLSWKNFGGVSGWIGLSRGALIVSLSSVTFVSILLF